VGSNKALQVDVSVISATNKILMDQVKSGSFREALSDRLSVIELYVPPLRPRNDDIPLLTEYFMNYFADIYGMGTVEMADECLKLFMTYGWPGNVRELKNVIERAVVLCGREPITRSEEH